MSMSPSFFNLALRDTAVFAVTFLVWHYFAGYSQGAGALADFSGVAIGAMVALCAHLLHEWGHVVGGMAGRSVMQPGKSMKSLSLFVYSSKGNSKKQFMLMSICGFIATGIVVLVSFFVLPDDYLASHVARGYSLIQVLLAVVLEFPLVAWALVGKSLPPIDKATGSY
jgi:hypothetical protein